MPDRSDPVLGDPALGDPAPRYSSLAADLESGELFPFAGSTYRRRITLRPEPGVIHAEMEDYVHHFEVRIEHVDGVVTATRAVGVRHPWDACPGGARGIAKVVGVPLADVADQHGWSADRSAQCVHVVDLAIVAARHALESSPTEFVIRIPDASNARRTATMTRNGAPLVEWEIDGDDVLAPQRFVGLSLAGSSFFPWVRANAVDEDEREAMTILRRAAYIGMSRGLDVDRYEFAADGGTVNNSCFVFQPEVAVRSRRMAGTTRPTELD